MGGKVKIKAARMCVYKTPMRGCVWKARGVKVGKLSAFGFSIAGLYLAVLHVLRVFFDSFCSTLITFITFTLLLLTGYFKITDNFLYNTSRNLYIITAYFV